MTWKAVKVVCHECGAERVIASSDLLGTINSLAESGCLSCRKASGVLEVSIYDLYNKEEVEIGCHGYLKDV
jgi:hypothetical protein